jgi:membrane-associated phospholipid phosphatase
MVGRVYSRPRLVMVKRRPLIVGLAGLAGFVLLTVLVQARLLAEIDLAATRAVQPLASSRLDSFGESLAIAFSVEVCILYGLIGGFLLWRAGLGRWSLAPLSFLALDAFEAILKNVVNQPPVPSEFYRGIFYPLTSITLPGTFPSGHAMRSAFVCVFLAVVLSRWRGTWRWLVAVGLIVLAFLCGFSRVYLGYHWLSDVLAGTLLGASWGYLVASTLVDRLSTRRASSPSVRHLRSYP